MRRGFSLVEVMVAMAVGGVIIATAVTSFKFSLDEQALSKREWQAFTIAQQRMELLSALPTSSPLLVGNVAATGAGTEADGRCDDIATGVQRFRMNGLGEPDNAGQFDVCYRITDGNPIGSKKNVRVVVTFDFQGKRHVILQSIR